MDAETDEPTVTSRWRRNRRFTPPTPERLNETGLAPALIEQLILKCLYFRGDLRGSELGRALGLKFSLLEPLLDALKLQHIIQVKNSLGFGPISALHALTEAGRRVAREHLEQNHYAGPAPVPIAQYALGVQAQRLPDYWLTPERLAQAYSHLVVSDALLDQIGPAVNASKTLLLYGPAGNGKTQFAQGLANIESSDIYLPYALEFQGNIIQLYDPTHHKVVEPHGGAAEEDDEPTVLSYDARWAKCRRPFITSGGELSLDVLDLSFTAHSGIYHAPLHLKANNGIYLIDDFGRQKSTTAEILNRWIVPMERRLDYLYFKDGSNMPVPFETFLIFASNLSPVQLGDEAFLRRIQYKLFLGNPSEEEFCAIFRACCAAEGLAISAALLNKCIERHYRDKRKAFRRYHPRELVAQAVDYLRFKDLPFEWTESLFDRVFAGCFPDDCG